MRRASYWLPPIVWALFIFSLSSGSLPTVTTSYWGDFAFKKFSHVLFFGLLALLIYRALVSENVPKIKAFYISIIATMLYGISDEIHQSFTPGRGPNVRDVIFDTIGAVLMLGGFRKLLERFPKWEEKLL